LREQRGELFRRVEYGDTEGVLRLLDLGYDPHMRDGDHRTLLHRLDRVRHEELVPRLLDAGVDIEALDGQGRTPLVAVVGGAPAGAVQALVEAGARTDAAYGSRTLTELIELRGRDDLDFLKEHLV
jgi:ankyrin repeat protein